MKKLWISLLGIALVGGLVAAPVAAAPGAKKAQTFAVTGTYTGTASVVSEEITIGATVAANANASFIGAGSLSANVNVFADGGSWTYTANGGSRLSGSVHRAFIDDSGALVMTLTVQSGTGKFANASGGTWALSAPVQVFDPANGFAPLFGTNPTAGTVTGQVMVG